MELLEACSGFHANPDTVLSLIPKNKNNLNCANTSGYTPLILAVCNINLIETLEPLIENGADMNKVDTWKWSALMHACMNLQVEAALILIEKGANLNLVGWGFIYGDTALDIVKHGGYTGNPNNEKAKLLVEFIQGRGGLTAAEVKARSKRNKLAKPLLENWKGGNYKRKTRSARKENKGTRRS